MANELKKAFLRELAARYGPVRKLPGSESLFEVAGGAARVYIRYSTIHRGRRTFNGLRRTDLGALTGHPSFICFLWDGQVQPLLVPYADYEHVFDAVSPASDGQYKAQVHARDSGTELYIARAGRFNVERYFGWQEIENVIQARTVEIPELSHPQVQTLLGAIGASKNYEVWIPTGDRDRLDWGMTARFECSDMLPYGLEPVRPILQEVDVMWVQRGSTQVRALFEVEHSTPIYSALLRFNDVHLVAPTLRPTFSIVANEGRRELFVRQLNRPTFQSSGLSELCSFLEYADVFGWHKRITSQ